MQSRITDVGHVGDFIRDTSCLQVWTATERLNSTGLVAHGHGESSGFRVPARERCHVLCCKTVYALIAALWQARASHAFGPAHDHTCIAIAQQGSRHFSVVTAAAGKLGLSAPCSTLSLPHFMSQHDSSCRHWQSHFIDSSDL